MLLLLWHTCRFAFGWVLALTALLMLGTRELARFNLVSSKQIEPDQAMARVDSSTAC